MLTELTAGNFRRSLNGNLIEGELIGQLGQRRVWFTETEESDTVIFILELEIKTQIALRSF